MQKIVIIITFSIVCNNCHSQHYIFSDIGNSVLLRPNIGFEKIKGPNAYSVAVQWQRNALFWVAEFPFLEKTKGFTADLAYRNFYKKNLFYEFKFRHQNYKGPNVITGWKDVAVINSIKTSEIGLKLGLRSKFERNYQAELSIGIGLGFTTPLIFVDNSEIYKQSNILTEEEIIAKFKNLSSIKFAASPHVQLRLFRKKRSK